MPLANTSRVDYYTKVYFWKSQPMFQRLPNPGLMIKEFHEQAQTI
jgi:hypothetical protein